MDAPPAEKTRKKWWMYALLAVSHVVVFVLGVVGDLYVLRLWTSAAHSVGEGPLVVVDQQWPSFGCSPATIAMPPGGAQPASFSTWPTTEDPVAQAGAALLKGELSVRLVTRDDKPVYIYGLSLVTFHNDPRAEPDWTADLQAGGCGDTKIRLFEGSIDKSPNIVDRGLVGDGVPDKETPTGRLGADFTVAADDPAHIYVDVHACRGLYEFGLQVKYTYLGDTYTDTIGSAEHPYKIMGLSRPAAHYTYDPSTAPQSAGSTSPPAACGTAPPDASPSPAAVAAGYPSSLEGTWSGRFEQDNGRSWTMRVRINAGATEASVEYPELGCSGVLTYVEDRDGEVKVRERITKTSGHHCTASGSMYLSQSNGQLSVRYFPDGSTYTGTATLKR